MSKYRIEFHNGLHKVYELAGFYYCPRGEYKYLKNAENAIMRMGGRV